MDTLTDLSTTSLIGLLITTIILLTSAAYLTGMLDSYIKTAEFYILRVEAGAEAKKLQAKGLKEGEDFVAGDLKGNQHADELKKDLGGIGGLGGGLKKVSL